MQTISEKGSAFPVCLQGLLNRQLKEYIRLFTMSETDFLPNSDEHTQRCYWYYYIETNIIHCSIHGILEMTP